MTECEYISVTNKTFVRAALDALGETLLDDDEDIKDLVLARQAMSRIVERIQKNEIGRFEAEIPSQ